MIPRSERPEREPRRLTEGLDAVMRSLNGPSAGTVRGVFGQWADAVGPAVAAHVTPIKLDGDVLVVEVDEPGWATQLRYLDRELIERLRATTGASIERLDVRVSRSAGEPARRRSNAR